MRYRGKPIRELPENLRPREKLLQKGEKVLSDEELLAILLSSGTKGTDVVSLSKEVLKLGWDRLREMPVDELMSYRGIGKVKALKIKALIELADRMNNPFSGACITSPSEAYEFLKDKFDGRKESLIALYLDTSHRLVGLEVVAVGTFNTVHALPKDILYRAVELSAYGIIVSHNHPGGDARPSKQDELFTQRLKEACKLLGFELIDHIILDGRCEHYSSMREVGLI